MIACGRGIGRRRATSRRSRSRGSSPSGDKGLLDGHAAVEACDQTYPGGDRNKGEGGSLEAADFLHPWLGCLHQGRDLDEWPGVAASGDVAGLAEHHHPARFVQHGRGGSRDGLFSLDSRLGRLHGCRAVRTGWVGEMKELQADVVGDISLTLGSEGQVNHLFVLLRQGHKALARRLGCGLRPDGAGLGWDVGPVRRGPQ